LAETVAGKDLESTGKFLKPLPILNKVVQAGFLYPLNTNITVTIERRADFLRLRWNDGKQSSLALGLRDAPANRAFATATKKKIENDWTDGNTMQHCSITIPKPPTAMRLTLQP
jgi:hypothetical protein